MVAGIGQSPILYLEFWILDLGSWILDLGSWILDLGSEKWLHMTIVQAI
jgi:hypothetical protein